MIKIEQIEIEKVPYKLLYLADEDDEQIKKYKDKAIFWSAIEESEIIGIIGLNEITKEIIEIVCIAVDETCQNRKIGTKLIENGISYSKAKGYKEIM